MVRGFSRITSYEDLKDQAAKLGIILFGLKHGGITMQDAEHELDAGIEVCDVIAQGAAFSKLPSNQPSLEYLAFVESFQPLFRRNHKQSGQVEALQATAEETRMLLETLLRGERLSSEAFAQVAAFFHRVYNTL